MRNFKYTQTLNEIALNKIMKNKLIYRVLKLLLIVLYLLPLSNCHRTIENQNNDILPLLIKIPNQLEFVTCKPGSGQTILKAKYRVSGTNAYLIENLLNKKYGMSKLKFTCCSWESHPDGKLKITDKFNNKYKKLYDYNYISISMHSEETLIQDRNKWSEIPYFYVIVEVLNI